MNLPTPAALLNRVRPKSCPATDRWSLSVGDLVADVFNAPGPLRRAARLLNHFGGVALSSESIEFDGDDVDWSDVTEIRSRNLVGYLLSDVIDRQAIKLPMPTLLRRSLEVDAVEDVVLTSHATDARRHVKRRALDLRHPANVN